MRNDPKVRAIEICLQKMQAGASLEQALDSYPQWEAELRPLLEAARAAHSLGAGIQIPPSAQARSRATFLEAAQSIRPRQSRQLSLSPGRLNLVALALILVLLVGAAITVMVSARALPGEALYPLKIASERTRLLVASDQVQRLELEQSFDQERIREVETLIRRSGVPAKKYPLEVNFAGGLAQIQSGEWSIGGIQVQIPANAQVIGQVEPGFYVDLQGYLQPDGTILAHRIRAREFEISGKLLKMASEHWVIGSITVLVNQETIIRGEPAIGSQVQVKAYLLADRSLQARLIESRDGAYRDG